MSRRPVGSSRRFVEDNLPFFGSSQSKPRSRSCVPISILSIVAVLLIIYAVGGLGGSKNAVSTVEGDNPCTMEVQRAMPFLKKAYGDILRKVLHIGPDTCSIVSTLLSGDEEGGVEAWGVEPYDIEDVDANCKSMVRKGIVRVADLKFPLPYKANSFSAVIVSDALDYLSPKYLNRSLPELARVAADALIIFAGNPGQKRAKVTSLSRYGRPAKPRSASWWIRSFFQTSLDENESADKKFKNAALKKSYKPYCQVFHLKPYR